VASSEAGARSRGERYLHVEHLKKNLFGESYSVFAFNEIDMFDLHRISSTVLGTLSEEMDRFYKVLENSNEKMYTLEIERRRRRLRHASGAGAARAVQAARDARDDYTERTACGAGDAGRARAARAAYAMHVCAPLAPRAQRRRVLQGQLAL
jgi:hypothetical protein